MALEKTSGNLKTDIQNALEKSMEGESNPEEYANDLSDAIQNFIIRQEFRVVKLESKIDVKHIKTTETIAADVSPDTLFGPYAPLISMLKRIPGASAIFEPLESKLKQVISKVSKNGASVPKLDLKEGGQGGDLDVKGTSNVDTTYKGRNSPTGQAIKSTVVLFKDEIND